MSRGGETTEGAIELLVIVQVGWCWWVETGCGLNLHRIVPKIVPMEKMLIIIMTRAKYFQSM